MPSLRILVVDDQEIIRKGICSTLQSDARFEVCGEAANGLEAIEKAQELNPDLIVLDITMPLLNGLEAARKLREIAPHIPVVILSVHKSRQLVEEARKIGVRGYVTKTEAGQNLVRALDAVIENHTFFPADF